MNQSFELPKSYLSRQSIPDTRAFWTRQSREYFGAQEENPMMGSHRRADEKRLLSYISLGNPTLVEELFAEMPEDVLTLTFGKISRNSLSQARYIMVAFITLYTRTAIDAGLPEGIAYNMSDSYISYLDQLSDINQIYALFYHALYDFTQAVHHWRLNGCGRHIRICCEYIQSHIFAPVGLTELSEACGLSPNYVSDLFRRELKVGPSQYIRRLKLEYACFLLGDPQNTVSDIASMLGFSSHSRFSEQFKQMYGMTPMQYRMGDQ